MCEGCGPKDTKPKPLPAEVRGNVRQRNVEKAKANGQTLDEFQEQPFRDKLSENLLGGIWNGFQRFRELKF